MKGKKYSEANQRKSREESKYNLTSDGKFTICHTQPLVINNKPHPVSNLYEVVQMNPVQLLLIEADEAAS